LGNTEIFFEKVFKHDSGLLLWIEIHPTPNPISANAQTLDLKVVHKLFGNCMVLGYSNIHE
jgi:hypothetical protein